MDLAEAERRLRNWRATSDIFAAADAIRDHLERVEKEAAFVEAAKAYFSFYDLPDSMLGDSSYGPEWGKAAIAYRALEGK